MFRIRQSWFLSFVAMVAFASMSLGDVTPCFAQMPANYQLQQDWLLDANLYVARVVESDAGDTVTMDNGLIRRTISKRLGSTIRFESLMTGESIIRSVEPEALITINGVSFSVGGATGQPNKAFLTNPWLAELKPLKNAMRLAAVEIREPQERLKWKRVRHHSPNAKWPPQGKYLKLDYQVDRTDERLVGHETLSDITVSVHYEIYDGLPLISKWLTVQNNGQNKVTVDRVTTEKLSVVEHSNPVEKREGVDLPKPLMLHVETDMAFGGFNNGNANRHVVHWRTDESFSTQVNYLKQMPVLLEVQPTYGPAQDVPPATTFESFRTFELVYDSGDRERRGLSLRKMYRTVAPWVTENPLMMHCKTSDEAKVKSAIDQAAEVGFEMVILSFGSGFNSENDDPAYLEKWKSINDYATKKNIHLGSYSLYSSRSAGKGNDIIPPDGMKMTHGRCPAITSDWGQTYLKKLYNLFDETGFLVFENDGPYPGDVDTTVRLPLQKGVQDSRWVHWRMWTDLYKHLRGKGVYMNLPDYYYLSGSNKCGMGYREVNWSLPREQQRIHTRQNIYDGTWEKTPSMGWMFVPLTEYHGGGAAATIEPLAEHLDHYDSMLKSNLGLGVQACYRGPRLFDTEKTRSMLKGNVAWFKKHRDILESDVIHGRRADGVDLDWMLHVNPNLEEKALLAVYNPTEKPITKTIMVPLYYSGLDSKVTVLRGDASPQTLELDRSQRATLEVSVPAQGFMDYVFQK